LDLPLAHGSYVRAPSDELRCVAGIEQIVADIEAAGITVLWDEHAPVAGQCYLWDRVIVLAGWVARCAPWWIRRVLAEELGHVLLGPREDRVWAWMEARYDGLVRPPDWGA
jgi:hypothetical protein